MIQIYHFNIKDFKDFYNKGSPVGQQLFNTPYDMR